MNNKWDNRFLDMAALVATWSKDPSTQVGAVIVDKDNRVVSVGFNGFPQHMPDHTDSYSNREEKYSRVIHAEMNALLFSNRPVHGCTIYSTLLSCDRCFVHLAQAGITRFVSPIAETERPWFETVRKYAVEMGITLSEIPR